MMSKSEARVTREQREIVDTIDPPAWLKRSAETVLWLCAPFQLAMLAAKLTPEVIESMSCETAHEWYEYLSRQYALILSIRPRSLVERTWIVHMRKSASKLEASIAELWEKSQSNGDRARQRQNSAAAATF